MLHEFVTTHHAAILAQAKAKVLTRPAPRPTTDEIQNGLPLFLDQLAAMLLPATKASEEASTHEITATAARHGGDLLDKGFTIAQVVHDYGDICQSITELAEKLDAPITTEEFHTLNRCLDDAIAEAVTEFSRLRDTSQHVDETERLGVLAHEMRNRLSAAMLAFSTLRSGRVGIGGSTGKVLERNLHALRDLIDRSLAEVRLEAGATTRERIKVTELVEEIELDAMLEANARGVQLTVAPVQRGLEIEGDRPILAAAVGNLLHNAFKFSHLHGQVTLTTTASETRVIFEIEDACGGLPEGKSEEFFKRFQQRGTNREGVGLGLSISKRGVEADGGEVRVRDLPGKGCVFTIDLPRRGAVAVAGAETSAESPRA